MEEVERTNVVIVCPNMRAELAQKNLYTMNMDKRKNQNCYNCGKFRHLAKNCRNRRNRIEKGRRLEYSGNRNNR